MKLYLTAENSDLTEGRGPMRLTGITVDPDRAVARVKGRGVMGVGDGEVYEIELIDNEWYTPRNSLFDKRYLYYGYRQDPLGRWGHGYTDFRDLPINDPEYKEYVRLREKFES